MLIALDVCRSGEPTYIRHLISGVGIYYEVHVCLYTLYFKRILKNSGEGTGKTLRMLIWAFDFNIAA